MPHLDDAAIAELLDEQSGIASDRQEHLDACAACRARVEEARGVRTRARAILRSTSAGAAPPFENILRQAGQPVRGTRRMPWRASVMVKLRQSLASRIRCAWGSWSS